jgi:hypothetical protein
LTHEEFVYQIGALSDGIGFFAAFGGDEVAEFVFEGVEFAGFDAEDGQHPVRVEAADGVEQFQVMGAGGFEEAFGDQRAACAEERDFDDLDSGSPQERLGGHFDFRLEVAGEGVGEE